MKRHSIIFTAIAIALSACGSSAQAQAGNDVQCLLASNLFAKASKGPKARAAAEASKFFYLGRVYGRLNAAQLRTQMLAQQKLITPGNASSIMNSCARQVDAAAKMVQAVTQELTKRK